MIVFLIAIISFIYVAVTRYTRFFGQPYALPQPLEQGSLASSTRPPIKSGEVQCKSGATNAI